MRLTVISRKEKSKKGNDTWKENMNMNMFRESKCQDIFLDDCDALLHDSWQWWRVGALALNEDKSTNYNKQEITENENWD